MTKACTKKKRSLLSKGIDLIKKRISSKKITPEPSLFSLSKTRITIYESELQFIGAESAVWETETGGDLFGIWNKQPIIYLATRTGPNSIREVAHFKLDVEYLIKLSGKLNNEWGLCYFGDWHSHHRLGLDAPSGGDKKRIKQVASKNKFDKMAEIIATLPTDYQKTKNVHIHPYLYEDPIKIDCIKISLDIIEGISPIRSALIASSSLQEQALGSFSSFSMEHIITPPETQAAKFDSTDHLSQSFGEKVLANALAEFEKISFQKIEFHKKSFGHIIVISIDEYKNVAYAIEDKWPYKILQVNWIDRSCGKAEELPVDTEGFSLVNIQEVKSNFLKLKDSRK